MKRVLAFLLLFGVGLALLLWLDRSRGGESPLLEPTPEQDEADPAQDGPGALPDEPEPQGFEAEISGRQTFLALDPETGKRRYRFEAEDMTPGEEGLYDATGVTVVVFEVDEASGESVPATTMVAERGRLRLVVGARVALGDEGRVLLEEVTVTQQRGGVLVPLVFEAPRLEVDIDGRSFRSIEEDVVTVTGQGLEAEGTGLVVEGASERFVFRSGGRIAFLGVASEEVDPQAPRSVELDTRDSGGEVRVERLEDGGAQATTRARGRLVAQLPPDPEDPAATTTATVDADGLEILARPDEGGLLIAERAEARGNVDAVRGRDRYRGQRADLELNPDGTLAQVVLEGEPRLDLVVEQRARGRVRLVPVVVSGEGPLVAELEGPLRFDLAGRSRLEAVEEGAVITATEGIEGEVVPEGRHGEFLARGEVRLVEARFQLETPELFARVPGDQERALDLEARGRTIASSEEPPLTLVAEQGLELQRRGELWVLPVAREVMVRETGEREWTLRAGLLRDVNWLTRSFEVQEGLAFEGFGVRAGGDSASVRGPERLDLRGSEAERAWILATGEEAVVHADLLLRRADTEGRETLRGEGEVEVDVKGPEGSLLVEADVAELVLGPPGARRTFELESSGVRRAVVERPEDTTRLASRELSADGTLAADGTPVLERLVARTEVELSHSGVLTVDGVGDRFEVLADGRARLSADAGERVSTWGLLQDGELPYEMTAEWVEYAPPAAAGSGEDPDRERLRGELTAQAPHVVLQTVLLPISPLGDLPLQGPGQDTRSTDARARRLVARSDGIELEGEVHVEGRDRDGRLLTVDAARAFLVPATTPRAGAPAALQDIEELRLDGGFEMVYSDRATAVGDSALLTATRALIEADPDGPMAQVKVAGMSLESHTIDVDLEDFLVTSTRGILRATGEAGRWSMRFASMRPVEEDAETMVVFGAPVYDAGRGSGARADWAVIWVHADSWRERARQELFGEEPTAGLERMVAPPLPIEDLLPNVFRDLEDRTVVRFARAIYLDGNAEVTEAGESVARGDTMYLDLVEAQGWMRGCELLFPLGMGSDMQLVRTRSAELYTASDGTLAADRATLTACLHDDPHYLIETGGLRIEPRARGGWRISAQRNVLRFQNGIQFPLPPLGDAVLDEAGGFRGFETADGEVWGVESLDFSSSQRFGTSVTTGLNSDIGRVGKGVGSVFGFDPRFVEGRWVYDGSWLGSRGALLGIGLRLRDRNPRKSEEERFWLDVFASGIEDRERDRGIVRVPVAERDELRTWYRARGRYPFSARTWVDVAFSLQSDPGVQAEFYQREFLNWEQRDNFVHWRTARGADYFNADVQVRLDDFRTEVERLPSLGAYRGRREVAQAFGIPLLYGASLDVEYLRRLQGDERFEFVFPDEPTDRTSLRIDNRHLFEAPMALGFGGLRLTPFTEARLTAWSEGLDDEDRPTRGAVLGGAELAGVYWKELDNDYVHEFTPSVRWKGDLAYEAQEDPPIFFDAAELPLQGEELDVGVRQRWWRAGSRRSLDLEVRAVHLSDRPDSLEDTLQLRTLGSFRDRWGSWPVAVAHDGRVDFELGSTIYSSTRFGFSPMEPLVLEVRHRRGADENGQRLFEAATFAGRWTLNEKWEVEGRQTISLREQERLNSGFLLRRYAHDFLFEIGVLYQAGEGGTFSLTWKPLLGWEKRPLGLIRPADHE